MSTTFGIKISYLNDEIIPVAHRYGIGNGKVAINILNPLLYCVRLDTELIAMDNSNQGIYTVNDLMNVKANGSLLKSEDEFICDICGGVNLHSPICPTLET